jgi:hypothetical protein
MKGEKSDGSHEPRPGLLAVNKEKTGWKISLRNSEGSLEPVALGGQEQLRTKI